MPAWAVAGPRPCCLCTLCLARSCLTEYITQGVPCGCQLGAEPQQLGTCRCCPRSQGRSCQTQRPGGSSVPCWPLHCPPAGRPMSGPQDATSPLPLPRSWLPAAACPGGRCHGMGPRVATLWLRQPFRRRQGEQGVFRHLRQGLGRQGALMEHSQALPKQRPRWVLVVHRTGCRHWSGGGGGGDQHAGPRHSKACIATLELPLNCKSCMLACRLGSTPQRPSAAL